MESNLMLTKKIAQNLLTDAYLQEYLPVIVHRNSLVEKKIKELCGSPENLTNFANGHQYYGLHCDGEKWYMREFAPNATAIFMVGDFSNWQENPDYELVRLNEYGDWQRTFPFNKLLHGQLFQLSIHWNGGHGVRISSYAHTLSQDDNTKMFTQRVWNPKPYIWKAKSLPKIAYPLIYEAHIGMATEEERVGTFREFADNIIPKIVNASYNTIQLMGIQEHPYYGSFGYHVSNFFAVSSRFGTPDDLKYLIDTAHQNGLIVIMDLVHSHSVKNTQEGLGEFDGSKHLYFHQGERREHAAWDSLCFDYGKNQVLHFLLSNCKYWLEEYKLDGFRFDGITSMLYYNHGLETDFTDYSMYYDGNQDEDAIVYLTLANILTHKINKQAITIAEEMSGMPALATPCTDGGTGFDYRMAMGIPDYWIKTVKEIPDENWHVGDIFYQLTNKRDEEKTISYVESHDQALVGDQTLIFRLIKELMYTDMDINSKKIEVDRGIALHKMIRLLTISCSQGGYLNFMGNEFGHPEWIDFPREGNNWSYSYARRQWNLSSNATLKYQHLAKFDKAMIDTLQQYRAFETLNIRKTHEDIHRQILAYCRQNMLFIFNFNPSMPVVDYEIFVDGGTYKLILNSDAAVFGGFSHIAAEQTYYTVLNKTEQRLSIKVYLPPRTAIVLAKLK